MMYDNVIQEDLFKDCAIQGELFTASITISDTEFIRFNNDKDFIIHVKKQLAKMLSEALLNEDKFVEFVRQQDMSSFSHKFYARMAVVPKNQLQLLRQMKKS